MDAYIYCDTLLCEDCTDLVETFLAKGPYPNGGGEADSPQHCEHCSIFLENPLTPEGERFTRKAIDAGPGFDGVIKEWSEFYGFPITY